MIPTGIDKERTQSWDAFLAKNFKPFITYVVKKEFPVLGLKVAEIGPLRTKRGNPASAEVDTVMRQILVDYGEVMIIPDVDMAFYKARPTGVLAVCALRPVSRASVIEAIYWKIMLSQSELTSHIRVFFVALRPSAFLNSANAIAARQSLAVLENGIDCVYMVSEETIEETAKLKSFDKFIPDMKSLANA